MFKYSSIQQYHANASTTFWIIQQRTEFEKKIVYFARFYTKLNLKIIFLKDKWPTVSLNEQF